MKVLQLFDFEPSYWRRFAGIMACMVLLAWLSFIAYEHNSAEWKFMQSAKETLGVSALTEIDGSCIPSDISVTSASCKAATFHKGEWHSVTAEMARTPEGWSGIIFVNGKQHIPDSGEAACPFLLNLLKPQETEGDL